MLDYMRKWLQGLGSRQHSVLNRLSKESVREHKNIRAAGEGGHASTEYSAAQNAGHEAQGDLGGFLSQVPVVGQATSFLSQMGNSGKPGGGFGGFGQAQSLLNTAQGHGHHGPSRDIPSGYPGEGYRPPSPPRGEAASYYSETRETTSYSEGFSMPSFPGPGRAPSYASEPSQSSYAPPSGPPPSFPSIPVCPLT